MMKFIYRLTMARSKKMIVQTYGKDFYIQFRNNGSLHPFDWEIEYRDINKNEFMIKIKKCGFITYADKFDARGILPGICAVDYIVAYYMKNGFHRTKTLGYGDDCFDCRYALNGSCPLKPGNGQK